MKYYLVGLLFSMLGSVIAQDHERLLIFMPEKSHPSFEFYFKTYDSMVPIIVEKADLKKSAIIYVDSSKGVPDSISAVPCVIFQSHAGEYIYQGRWNDLDRIVNHIETSRYLPLNKTSDKVKSGFVLKRGKWKLLIPIKISDITGNLPEDYNSTKFKQTALDSVLAGFSKIVSENSIELLKTDRRFYFDFYPWLDPSGNLYLSGKIFSQFHCKKEIWFTGKSPINGTYKNYSKSFSELSTIMEDELIKFIEDFKNQDSLIAVSENNIIKDYKELGFDRPIKESEGLGNFSGELPLNFVVSKKYPSRTVFHFLAPNEYLSGIVKSVTGSMNFSKGLEVKDLVASFVADMDSVSMGDEDLNIALSGKSMLNLKEFGTAKITFQKNILDPSVISFGKEVQFHLEGFLVFKGISKPIKVGFALEPIVKGAVPYLSLKANFIMDVSSFGLEGAPGDSKDKNLMEFSISLFMEGVSTKE